jgi:hypothetical protein
VRRGFRVERPVQMDDRPGARSTRDGCDGAVPRYAESKDVMEEGRLGGEKRGPVMYPWRHNVVWREGCKSRSMVSGRTWGLFGVRQRHQTVGCGEGGCGVCVCVSVWCVRGAADAGDGRVEVEGPALI